MNNSVQVCSFKNTNFKEQFIESILSTGFAVITDHGISHEHIKEVQMSWRLFFLQSQEEKNKFINQRDSNLGYHGYKKEQAVGASAPDLKEFFHWMPGASIPSDYGSTESIYLELEDLGLHLLDLLTVHHIQESTSPVPDYMHSCLNSDKTLLRSLYYPAKDYSKEPGSVRAAAHQDINHITLLVAATAPGLEIRDKEGNWHAVPHEENSIAVNIGNMLELHSKGFYRSTTHRVVNADNSGSDRISIPLFIHPSSDTVLRDDGFTAREYLDQRIKEIYGGRK